MTPRASQYVVQGGWIVAAEGRRLTLRRNAHLIVDSGVIKAIVEGRYVGDWPVVAVPEALIVPGFVSGHTHVASATPTRGLIEGGRSARRSAGLVAALDDDDLDALTAYNLAEILRSGCTTQLEMSQTLRQAESYVRIAKRWGVRGYPGAMIPATPRVDAIWARTDDAVLFASEADTLREIAANLDFGRRHMNAGDGRLRPMMSPHATDTHTPKTMAALRAAALELGTGLHLHLAQGESETAAVRRLWQMTPAAWLEHLGLLDMPVFGAHMMALDWTSDPAILRRHGVVYVHCPSAGGASRTSQPYPEALGAGLLVNIGIDTHSNDYLENLKLAVIGGRIRAGLVSGRHPGPVIAPTVWDALAGATIVAADALGRPDLGRLAPGARADFAVIDLAGFLVGAGALPPDPLHHLLYANGLSVRHVATDGRFQVFDGALIVDDERQVISEGARVAEKIWAQLAAEGRLKGAADGFDLPASHQ
ncbi:MAG: amidohydrolase family protein [Alphaproteobacteria bacterium]|nr:amidohydrolase family protein [Alphaproteobacteria bacterium]